MEAYTVIAEDYKKFSAYEGYLIGAKQDEELKRSRRRGFAVLSYADIIGSTRERYREFLQTLEEG